MTPSMAMYMVSPADKMLIKDTIKDWRKRKKTEG
jgi:hypothetical protein